jgi:ATP-dependent DNA helicase RecG
MDDKINDKISDRINEQNDKIKSLNDKINDKIQPSETPNLSALDEMILQIISDDSSITIPKIAERVKKSAITVHRHIDKLVSEGIIERIGSRKSGFWKVR